MKTSFWDTWYGMVIRWIFFLPVAFLVTGLLEMVGLITVALLAGIKLKSLSLLMGLVVLVLSPFALAIGYFYFIIFYLSGPYICVLFTKGSKAALVIFGTLQVLHAFYYYWNQYWYVESWQIWAHMGCSALIVGSTIQTYLSVPEKSVAN